MFVARRRWSITVSANRKHDRSPCLDGHSRSKMWLFMISMRRAGMLKREDRRDFSEEIQKQVFDYPL